MKFLTKAALCLATLAGCLGFIPDGHAQVQLETELSTTTEFQGTLYERAKAELPEDWYAMYRITERIARANDLQERPWRIQVIPKYDINAFATDANLIALFGGLVDQLAGDTSAIACVVGHEMAHHSLRHIPLGQSQTAERAEQIEQEARQEIEQEAANAQSAAILGSVFGGLTGINTRGISQAAVADAQRNAEAIAQQKQEQFKQEVAAQNRQFEFDADEKGFIYAVKAGFEPAGCTRALQMLAQLPGSEFDTHHPNTPARIDAIAELSANLSAEDLKEQGKYRLLLHKPLDYSLAADGRSLRINSRFGNADDDFERLFGE